MKNLQKERFLSRFGIYFLLFLQCMVIVFPLLLMVMSSFKENREIFRTPFKLPGSLYLENYKELFLESNYLRYFLNSILVSSAAIILTLLVSSLAAYAISKYRFPLNRFVFFYFLAGLMIPIRLGTINIIQIFIRLNLYDNLLSLIIIYAAYGIPPGILIFSGFMREIPNELSDSARVDGCSEISIFRRIIVPLIGPAIVVVAVYNLIPIWNDFWFPLVLINSDNLMTIPLATAKLFGKHETNYGLIFTILTVAAIPPMILFATLSRYFIKGLTAGAVKG
jgi:raffinose/stachyose/melibiose transport system permease protein